VLLCSGDRRHVFVSIGSQRSASKVGNGDAEDGRAHRRTGSDDDHLVRRSNSGRVLMWVGGTGVRLVVMTRLLADRPVRVCGRYRLLPSLEIVIDACGGVVGRRSNILG
jgi:hypothetical protein